MRGLDLKKSGYGQGKSDRSEPHDTLECVAGGLGGNGLSEWVQEAQGVFGSYGFIVSNSNVNTTRYGFEHLYEEVKGAANYKIVNSIKELRGGKKRLYAYDLGLIGDHDVYFWFADMVGRQNNGGAVLISPEGERKIARNGRFCNIKGQRSIQIERTFKEGIGPITDCIMLSLTVHEKEVLSFMPGNTNLLPVEFATVMIGSWVRYFLVRLRQFQETRGLSWEYVGYVVEFQQGDEKVHGNDPSKMYNGFPHVHMIFRGKWIGKIQEIASLWPYCEPQGVDYMDRKKYERGLRAKGKLKSGQHPSAIRLINYVTKYVAKCSKAVVTRDGKVFIHKGYAWLAFSGGRMFNVARNYKRENKKEKQEGWQYEGWEDEYKIVHKQSKKKPEMSREIDHTCPDCGKKIYKDSFELLSHLCIVKEKGGERNEVQNVSNTGNR